MKPVVLELSSAENHPYLHYSQYNRLLSDGDFLVADAGPKVKGCLAYYRPDVTGYQVGEQVRALLKTKGYDLSTDAFTRLRFFKEGGITHFVGLATHDAGGRDLDPGRILKPGMVFACDVFAVFPGEDLGVRVENTVLITESGCEILYPGIPREIEEIEALMRTSVK